METTPSRELLHRWLLALGCLVLLLLVFCPPLYAFLTWARVPEASFLLELRRGASVLYQMNNLGEPVPDALHAVIQWRLLFPLLGAFLGISAPLLFSLAHLGCLFVLVYLATLLRRSGYSWRDCALALITLGAGSWFFTSTGWLGYYDSWLVLALLFVGFSRSNWPVWAACLWAPWVDERFVIAFPLALLCRLALKEPLKHDESTRFCFPDWKRELLPPVALVALFVVIRLLLLPSAPKAGVSGYLASQKNLEAPIYLIFWGIWEGLRGAWLFALAAVVLLRRRKWDSLVLGLVAVGILLSSLVIAQDFSRSMSMLFPLALLGLLLAKRSQAPWLSRALLLSAPAVLLLPAHHIMSNRVSPIYYLQHEIFQLSNPPKLLQPELYELKGIHAMEQGNLVEAEAQLLLAIRLSKDPSSPSKHRGMLRAGSGRWAEALEDFSTMVQYRPSDPEGWFLRAQAHFALGDSTGARSDFRQALTKAPENWAQRPDVARFKLKLER